MSRITILGGTGFTGSNIAREAAARGHEVTSFSRNAPAEPVAGVRYVTDDLTESLPAVVTDAEVIIGSLAPRGELEGELRDLYASVAVHAASAGVRFGVIGGFSALRLAPGAERTAHTDNIPAQYATEARVMTQVLEDLIDEAPDTLDWFYVSPAGNYGAHVPGEALGTYRVGGEVALFDAEGNSAISGADFATAVVDEIETPAHPRQQFGVAY